MIPGILKMEMIEMMDLEILSFVRDHMHTQAMDTLLAFVTTLGNYGAIWIVLGLVLLVKNAYRRTGVLTLVALLATHVLASGILKPLFARQRPYIALEAFSSVLGDVGGYSFPSGHATAAFTIATVLYFRIKKWRIPMLIAATVMAFTRIYFHVHYPSDVVAGILLGSGTSYLLVKLDDWLIERKKTNFNI